MTAWGPVMKMNKNNIKLIATDLDGTLLDYNMALSAENKNALEQAAEKGVMIVVATGRSFLSIPDYVREIKGINYAVTANGAKTHDFASGELISGQYISERSIDAVWEILNKKGIMLEVFVEGRPYVHNWDYVNPQIFGSTESYIKYFMASRKPVGDIFSFIKENKNKIENINLVFRSPDDRLGTLYELEEIQDKTGDFALTSSFPFNLEIGGVGVDKANAIEMICKAHGINREETMCIGDNNNDSGMVEFAGIGVAMEDAVPGVKDVADFVTKSSSESGVAFAVEKYIF